jgi:hypothetical protein
MPSTELPINDIATLVVVAQNASFTGRSVVISDVDIP